MFIFVKEFKNQSDFGWNGWAIIRNARSYRTKKNIKRDKKNHLTDVERSSSLGMQNSQIRRVWLRPIILLIK